MVFATDYLTQNGTIARDAEGAPIPRFIPGVTQVWAFQATRGARVDITTTSVIAQDRWYATPRLTVDLGARFEAVRSSATGDIDAANAESIVPRLGASYNFPEIYGPALDRLMPAGRLDNYQRHKLRVYANYAQSLGRFGSLDLAPLWRVNSGGVYSLTASIPVPAVQLARNPGYPTTDINTATRQTVFFGERGGNDLKGYGVMDFAASYNLAVWKSARPWFKVEVYNALNNQKLIGWDRTVTANATGPLDANGIPTGYVAGAKFGQATSGNHYPQPYGGQNGGRAIRFAFGARF